VQANRWRKVRGRIAAYRRHGAPLDSPAPTEETVILVDALRRLPVEQRRALVLHHILDLSVADIATETAVPVGTVKARLRRARQALAARLPVAEENRGSHHV
jgi:RNA polymerase sigma factor (sigma-70 family)